MQKMSLETFTKNRIKELLHEREITAVEFAAACNLSKSSLYYSLQDDHIIGVVIIEKLCTMLHMSPAEFFAPYGEAQGYNQADSLV